MGGARAGTRRRGARGGEIVMVTGVDALFESLERDACVVRVRV